MPVKLFDSPGYKVFPDAESVTDVYDDLRQAGYDFVVVNSDPALGTAAKEDREEQIGGASVHRPLTYQEFDENFKEIYPIGSIYMNATNPANPLQILGFGTWERIPAGNTLFNIASSTLDSTNLRQKIRSASISNNVVTLKIKPLVTEDIRNNLRVQDFNANNYRMESLVVGQQIHIRGLSGGSGAIPNGIHTITEIQSEEWSQTDRGAATYDVEEDTYDENTIRFNFTSDYNGSFNVLGPSDGQEDDAYYTTLDDSILNVGEVNRIGIGNSYGNFDGFDVKLNIQHYPPHNHGRANGNVQMIQRFTGSTGKYHKWDDGTRFYDGPDYSWYHKGYGSHKVPSGTSTSSTAHSATTISSAGTLHQVDHENRQPFMAVNMWKTTG